MASETHEKTRLCLKSVSEIVNSDCPNFFVDKYQRGYKWDSEQVQELLDDINNFKIKDLDSFYCLQPIIVKYRHDEKAWELIDGQQRITTIYLMLTYLKNNQHLQIKYKTRESSEEFLKLISRAEFSKETTWSEFIDQYKYPDNVDNYHFFNAYQTIMTWFEEDRKDFLDKLCKYTKVIWYDVTNDDASDQENSIGIFSRVNAGKIKLTDAELIKALMLNGSTVDFKNYAMMVDRAKEWDDIEKTLQDDEFWYFINGSANTDNRPNRIEFLLSLVADDIFKDEGVEIKKKGVFGEDALHYIFYCFYFSKNNADNWIKVKNYFEIFQEWFKDNKSYHYIGYLVYCCVDIKDIFKECRDLPKSQMVSKLKDMITKKAIPKRKALNDLTYAEDKGYIKNILLLFNIETIISGEGGTRFLFDRFVKKKWSLEHIHAQNAKASDGV